MKQLIISKTMIFIFVLLFVTGFETVFGQENVLIGVTTVVAMLMYLQRDFTVSPWKSLLLLLAFNLSQGVFSQLAVMNPWIGLPINFFAMFMVGYFFTSNIKGPIHIAVGLQYLFLLTNPVPLEDFPLRLSSLAAGAIFIMLVQWLFNRRKLSKRGNRYFLQVCDHLQEKINRIRDHQSDQELDAAIQSDINEFRKVIYFRRIKGYYLTHEGRVRLKISVCLEKLHLMLSRADVHDCPDEVLKALELELGQMKDYMKHGTGLSDDSLNRLNKALEDYGTAYIVEIISTLTLLRELLVYLHTSKPSELNKVEKVIGIPEGHRNGYQLIKDINRDSARFTYALRLGMTITAAAFMVDYFNIHEGRWIIFTIFSVTQPYYEAAKYRFKERLIGTFMGAAIFIVAFNIFQDTTMRTFLVMLAGYLNSYAVEYRNVVLTVTISALGSAALTSGDPTVLTMRRIVLVLIGIGIGMLANRFILPHGIEKGTRDLMEDYKKVSQELLREVYIYLNERNNAHTINHLFAASTLMEERIRSNNQMLKVSEMDGFLAAQRRLNHAIYEVFLRMQKEDVDVQLFGEIFEELDTIFRSEEEGINEQVSRLYERLYLSKSLEEYVLLKDALRIYKGFRRQACFE